MIVGVAAVPTAPLIVPGVSATLPVGAAAVSDAVDAALDGLPAYDLGLLVAAAPDDAGPGVHGDAHVTLAGIGRPDIGCRISGLTAGQAQAHQAAIAGVTRMTQYPLYRGEALPLGLAVLALLVGASEPLVPVAVPATAGFDALVGIGTGLVEAVDDMDLRAVVVAAGDLSAGLGESSPLYRIDGAQTWDDEVVAAVDSGRLDRLERLGPAEARRVGAWGWAPLSTLHGVCARAKIGLVRRSYSAPRGVGYLVAHGA